LLFFVFFLPKTNEEIRKTQTASPYGALENAIIIALDGYYTDGATAEMLKDFEYISYGNKCELPYFSEYYNNRIKK